MDLDLSFHRMITSSRLLMSWHISQANIGACTWEESLAALREITGAREAVETRDLEGQLAQAAEFERDYKQRTAHSE
jgi:hypothetical protein